MCTHIKKLSLTPLGLGVVLFLTFSFSVAYANEPIVDVDYITGHVTLSRWAETSLEISLRELDTSFFQSSGETDNKQLRFYELPKTNEMPEGGYEIEVVLLEKPSSNTITFNIKSHNLEFFYQPPLNEENHDEGIDHCTETRCFDAEGNLMIERPENVVGSYAVYYKDGVAGDYSLAGGKNYRTGKAFHIYRPKITDANNKNVWGELNIDSNAGTLTITIPQDFFDSAEYPVIVDPTFGYGAVGETWSYWATGTIGTDGKYYSPAVDGTIDSMFLYGRSWASSANVQVALYDTSDSLVDNSGSALITNTDAWWEFPMNNVDVSSSGGGYNLAFNPADYIIRYYDTGQGMPLHKEDTQTYGTWPDPITWDTKTEQERWSLYASYTVGPVVPLNEQAASLAKELVNSAYLYGGKGWDYNQSEFVAPSTIKTSYVYWDQAIKASSTGAGVDCSGLVMWAYDRSFNPLKSRFNNFVTVEKADQQYRYNSTTTTEAQLQPGNVMFFDWGKWQEDTKTWDGIKDGHIDHVAMYVGASDSYDVVNARSPRLGIRGMLKNDLRQWASFVGFKRIVQGPPPSILTSLSSPADLVVTDPDGFTITPETIIPSEVEELREIPGILYYSEMEQGADGRPADQVYSYIAKTGDYKIQVIPESDALPTDTYSLFFTTDLATTTVLADSVLISDIPTQPYLIRLAEGVAEKVIPAKVKITPRTLNLGNKGLFKAQIEISKGFGATIADIDTTTIEIQGVKAERTAIADNKYLIAFFKTQDLNVIAGEEVELKLTGNLKDGTKFEGTDTLMVISKGRFSVLSLLLANLHEALSKLLEMF